MQVLTLEIPELLILAVLLLPVVYYIRAGYLNRERTLTSIGGSQVNFSSRSKILIVLSSIFLISLLVTAAWPTRALNPQADTQSAEFVFLVDVSRSMAARTGCNVEMRLDRAKSLMADIVTELPSARFAFSAFSGLAFTLSEFSWDRQYLLNIIQNGIFIEVVPIPGSDISNALYMILEKKAGQPSIYKEMDYVVLISDGDIDDAAYEELTDLVQPLRDSGITVIGVGIGSDDAIPIPTLDDDGACVAGQFERADGREFYTVLSDKPIRLLPEGTGGAYFHESDQTGLFDYLRTELTESSERRTPPDQTKDIGYFFLAISTAILFALIGMRQIW